MSLTDIQPPKETPVSERIASVANNRLGAVYSALYDFWTARTNGNAISGGRRDSYSAVMFSGDTTVCFENDLGMEPMEMLDTMLKYSPEDWTNFDGALAVAKSIVEKHWNQQR